MNYLSKIAFLGKKKLQDYSVPRNNFVMVAEKGNIIQKAVDETGIIVKDNRAFTRHSLHTDQDRVNYYQDENWTLTMRGWDFYYNPNTDVLIIMPYGNAQNQNVEKILEYFSNLTPEQINSIDRQPLAKELLK